MAACVLAWLSLIGSVVYYFFLFAMAIGGEKVDVWPLWLCMALAPPAAIVALWARLGGSAHSGSGKVSFMPFLVCLFPLVGVLFLALIMLANRM